METLGASETLETLGSPIHARQLGGTLDQLERQTTSRLEIGVERWLPATAHRAPPVDLRHNVERLAQDVARLVGCDQFRMGNVCARQGAHQPDFTQQFVQPAFVGAISGHAHDHPAAAAFDHVERVLRPTRQLLEIGQFTVSRDVIVVEPSAQEVNIDAVVQDWAPVAFGPRGLQNDSRQLVMSRQSAILILPAMTPSWILPRMASTSPSIS